MKALVVLGLIASLCAALLLIPSCAQGAPGAPTLSSVAGGGSDITIQWTAPANYEGSAITSYGLSYVCSDKADTATDSNWTEVDDAWTSGSLTYQLTNLRRDTSYGVALRAENTDGEGDWSDKNPNNTTDHGDSTAETTSLEVGSTIAGSIATTVGEDYFRIVVSSQTDLWVYTTGPLDTTGYLLNSSGTLISTNEESGHIDSPRAFSLREQISTGTYYGKDVSQGQTLTGPYAIHAQQSIDFGDNRETVVQVELQSVTPAKISYADGPGGTVDDLTLVLTQVTEVWAVGSGTIGAAVTLRNNRGAIVVNHNEAVLPYNPTAFVLRATLPAETYYLEIRGLDTFRTGLYGLELQSQTEPGGYSNHTTPIALDVPHTGKMFTSSDNNRLTLSVEDDSYATIHALSLGDGLHPVVSERVINALSPSLIIPHAAWQINLRRSVDYWDWAALPRGSYDIGTSPPATRTGPYLVSLQSSRSDELLELCEAFASDYDDPLYGCQWHLNNTGQFPHGASKTSALKMSGTTATLRI